MRHIEIYGEVRTEAVRDRRTHRYINGRRTTFVGPTETNVPPKTPMIPRGPPILLTISPYLW